LVGGVVVPVMAQTNVSLAYTVPVIALAFAVGIFVMGNQRYVRSPPKVDWDVVFGKKKKRKAIILDAGEQIPLSVMLRVCSLVIPFNIAYSQMATTFIVQGNVMQKAFGWIDAASMNNADAVAVLVFGYIVGSVVYPWCAERNIKIPTTYKFALGSCLGAAAIAWALMVEHMIQRRFLATGEKVSILWQAMSYILIGIGEIFAVSAAYEVAFTASPPDKKVICSAVNLFCIGGIPNIICVGLYQACHVWFQNGRGTANISHVEDYVTSHVSKYFWLLFWISIAGTLLNMLPPVKDFVESVEEQAIELIRTPKTPARPPIRSSSVDDTDLLLNMKRHQYYLKYGHGPSLYKMGTLRAGPPMRSQSVKKLPTVSRKVLTTLYGSSEPSIALFSNTANLIVPARLKHMPPREEPSLHRANSD
jgi:proton-dependent oligopeptide transporter, POT family